eukprot:UN27540
MSRTPQTPETKKSPFNFGNNSNGSPSLWDSATRQLKKRLKSPAGSLRASTLTVITSMVGGGVLALPYAFMKVGVVPSLLYFVITMILSAYSVFVLIVCAHQSGCLSYFDMAKASYGMKFGLGIELLLACNLFGVVVAYQTMVRNLLPLATEIIFGKGFWDNKIILLICCTCIFILPLAIQREVGALRYGCLVGFLLTIFLIIVTIVIYLQDCGTQNYGPCFQI